MAFRWTPRRDAELQSLRAVDFSYRDIGNMLGCSREEAIARMAQLRRAPAPAPDFKAVPRPPETPRPATVQRPQLIDLRKAPSSMEMQAAAWGKR